MHTRKKINTLPVAKATVFPDSTSAIAFFICATRNYSKKAQQSRIEELANTRIEGSISNK
jgi:uncharacterized membrane protein YpjA